MKIKELSLNEGYKKKEALVLAQHQMHAKHLEGVHMWLSPTLVALIVNTAAGCSCRRALSPNTVIPTTVFLYF